MSLLAEELRWIALQLKMSVSLSVVGVLKQQQKTDFENDDDDNTTQAYTLEWKYASDGYVPANAVIAGHFNGETSYVGRTRLHHDGFIPGKVQPSREAILYVCAGKICRANNYEVLVNYVVSGSSATQLTWIEYDGNFVPPNAITCGYKSPVYIGRIRFGDDDDVIVEKVVCAPRAAEEKYASKPMTCVNLVKKMVW